MRRPGGLPGFVPPQREGAARSVRGAGVRGAGAAGRGEAGRGVRAIPPAGLTGADTGGPWIHARSRWP